MVFFVSFITAAKEDKCTACHRSIHVGMNKMITKLEQRIASWSQIPVSHGEPIQVLRYEIGQEYQPHYDYFFHKGGMGNNRIATVLMYLSDVEVSRFMFLSSIARCTSCQRRLSMSILLSTSIFFNLLVCVRIVSVREGGRRDGISKHRKTGGEK